MALHWTKRILSEGRGLGLTIFCGSQRPQSVHNGVLTQCETLVGMRLTHDADCSAVETWLKRTRDKAKREEVLVSIPEMPRGEGWVWSPEIGFGPERVKFPMFNTFDSFAPPQLQKKVSASDWTNVDLEAVKTKLAGVIEEHKQNDPAELKRTVATLKRELAESRQAKSKAEPKEVPVFSKAELAALERLERILKESTDKYSILREAIQQAMVALKGNRFAQPRAPLTIRDDVGREHAYQVTKRVAAVPAAAPTNGDITGGLRRMMIALAQRPGLTKKQLGVRAGMSSSSGTFGTYLGKLRSSHWIHRSDPLVLTDEGRDALGAYDPLPEGQELLRYWLGELGDSGAGRMLKALADHYPQPMTKEQLGEAASISATSGTFGTYLGKLRTLELVEGRGELNASKEFFE